MIHFVYTHLPLTRLIALTISVSMVLPFVGHACAMVGDQAGLRLASCCCERSHDEHTGGMHGASRSEKRHCDHPSDPRSSDALYHEMHGHGGHTALPAHLETAPHDHARPDRDAGTMTHADADDCCSKQAQSFDSAMTLAVKTLDSEWTVSASTLRVMSIHSVLPTFDSSQFFRDTGPARVPPVRLHLLFAQFLH